jgi:hypothetical protein
MDVTGKSGNMSQHDCGDIDEGGAAKGYEGFCRVPLIILLTERIGIALKEVRPVTTCRIRLSSGVSHLSKIVARKRQRACSPHLRRSIS